MITINEIVMPIHKNDVTTEHLFKNIIDSIRPLTHQWDDNRP